MRSDPVPRLLAGLAALSLALPAPAAVHPGRVVTLCGGGVVRLPLPAPGRRDRPDEGDCRLACHAALCRKRGDLPCDQD